MLFGGLRRAPAEGPRGAGRRPGLRPPARLHRAQRGAAAGRLRLHSLPALRENRLDRAGDAAARAEQLCRPPRSVGFRRVNRRLVLCSPSSPLSSRCPPAPPPRRSEAAPKPAPAPEATVKIKVGHLHERPRRDLQTRSRSRGTLAPYVAGEKVEGHLLPRRPPLFSRNLAVAQGRAAKRQLRDRASRSREDGKYAVAAKHVATPTLGADSTVRKSWKVELPGPAPGRMRQGRRGLQEGDAGDGLHRQRRHAASAADRPRASSPTARSTT